MANLDKININGIEYGFETEDSGWQTATLSSLFKPYNNKEANTPKYRRSGKIVEIRGTVSPSSEIAGSSSGKEIFTIPEGYRPSDDVNIVCQGSGKNIWLLTVKANGNVLFARYGTTEFIACPSSGWLPLSVTYIVA